MLIPLRRQTNARMCSETIAMAKTKRKADDSGVREGYQLPPCKCSSVLPFRRTSLLAQLFQPTEPARTHSQPNTHVTLQTDCVGAKGTGIVPSSSPRPFKHGVTLTTKRRLGIARLQEAAVQSFYITPRTVQKDTTPLHICSVMQLDRIGSS